MRSVECKSVQRQEAQRWFKFEESLLQKKMLKMLVLEKRPKSQIPRNQGDQSEANYVQNKEPKLGKWKSRFRIQESQKVKFNEAKRPEQEGLVKLKKRKAGQA